MSAFEERFPKPDKKDIFYDIYMNIWQHDKLLWRAALEWAWRQRTKDYEHISFEKIMRELNETDS